MNLKTVTKRSGHTVAYDREKIFNAIAGANVDGGSRMTDKDIDEVASQVEWDVQDRENVSVEEIQDIVEQELMKYDFYDVAKKYITYRQKHTERRAAQKHLMESYKDIFFADAVDVETLSLELLLDLAADEPLGVGHELLVGGERHSPAGDLYRVDRERLGGRRDDAGDDAVLRELLAVAEHRGVGVGD